MIEDLTSCDRRGIPLPIRGQETTDLSSVDSDMLTLMNQARAESGLPPMICHPALVIAATKHSEDMAKHDKLSHYGLSFRSTWATRCEVAGYPGASLMTIREDIGAGQTSAEQLMGDYSQSPGHWAAIMDPKAQHAGSAACQGKSGWIYWCTDFGREVQ